MCGIFGYTGTRRAAPILLDGLRALEYRGYDSAGIYVPGQGSFKVAGKVDELAAHVPASVEGTCGIAHTRWATHGPPTELNAHPHHDKSGSIWLVHNGIIENYEALRSVLEAHGSVFESDTDTEVLAHLVGAEYERSPDLAHAVTAALARVEGTYGIAVMHQDNPGTIVVARLGSPVVLGIKDGEYIVASDAAPILRHTKDVVYLEDGECAVLSQTGYHVFTLDHTPAAKKVSTLDWNVEEVQKNGFPDFMLKEIAEVPEVLKNSMRGRVMREQGTTQLGGLSEYFRDLRTIERIVIVGCGSAYYAGMVGKLLIEEYAHVPVEIELASEFRYRSMIASPHTAVLAISQSGETADTLASVREAKHQGLLTLGIVNVVGSTIARETDAGIYNHAGPEIGVASTKAFLSQLEVLVLLAVYLGRARGLSRGRGAELLAELEELPAKVAHILARKEEIRQLAEDYLGYDDFLYIGRKYNLPTAYEGALKLKEVSYVHAEGCGAGEMKHGPIAMIDEWFPVVAIAPSDSVYHKMRSSIAEIKARNGRVLAIATQGNKSIKEVTDDVFFVPETKESLTPLLMNIPLQLFAYYQGVLRGYNVDKPRNLAKSVTVE